MFIPTYLLLIIYYSILTVLSLSSLSLSTMVDEPVCDIIPMIKYLFTSYKVIATSEYLPFLDVYKLYCYEHSNITLF